MNNHPLMQCRNDAIQNHVYEWNKPYNHIFLKR